MKLMGIEPIPVRSGRGDGRQGTPRSKTARFEGRGRVNPTRSDAGSAIVPIEHVIQRECQISDIKKIN